MRAVLKTLAASAAIGMFLSATAATAAPNEHANEKAFENSGKHEAPEIHPVAASAVGILLVGGLALLTTRRRGQAA